MSTTLTLIIVFLMLVVLIREWADSLIVFLVVVTLFLLLGYINLDEAVSGFSNKGVLAIAALYIIASSLEKSLYFKNITRFDTLNETNFNALPFYGSLMALSAFMNNTPLVSLYIPIVRRISLKTGIHIQKLLIPVSYFALFGGVLTLIGTSTNLVVSGLAEDYGFGAFHFFEQTPIAIPAVLFASVYVFMFYRKRLPARNDSDQTQMSKQNEHVVRFVVHQKSPIIDKTVAQAKLRSLKGVYLFSILRQNERIFPVTPDTIIKAEDILVFSGQTQDIDELKQIDSISLETDQMLQTDYFNNDNTLLVEAVMTGTLGSSHESIKDLKFRDHYHAVVLGVIRNGLRIEEKIGDIVLRLGDTLLLLIEKSQLNNFNSHSSFTIINQEDRDEVLDSRHSFLPIGIFILTILVSSVFNVDILYSALFGISLLFLTNTITVEWAISKIDFKTIIMISLSFAIGKAMTNTGVSTWLGQLFMVTVGNAHPLIILAGAYIFTNILTEIITNNAAAVLAVPIVVEIAQLSHLDVKPFLLVVAIAASASFLSPYGYQTNLMVYAAGRYRFRDFIKFGFPVTFIFFIATVLTTYALFFA